MKRVLIMAYYFPPIGGIGAIRMARFATYLPESGWDPTVIAPTGTPHALDPNLTFPEDKVIRARSIELARLGRMLPRADADAAAGAGAVSGASGADPVIAGAAPSRAARIRSGLRGFADRRVFYPDAQIGWYPAAVRAGTRALRDQHFDAILSSSYPVTAHLVARRLAKRAGVPWVAEFRDPWAERLAPDHPYAERARKLAAGLAHDAARVIVPSASWAAYYGELWGRSIDVIPNGHDLEPQAAIPPAEPTITHVGSYYPERQNLRALWAAAAKIEDDVRVRFIGALPTKVRREVESSGVTVEETGFVPNDEAMRAMQDSTVLVASGFDDDDPMSRGVIPAKLFEYLATPLPIIYFGHAEDDAATLLRDQPGTHVVVYDDLEGATTALRAALDAGPVERDAAQFSRRSRARDLARVLEHAASSAAR
jgi:glycosyltransferase involved in cell wall biosynthesis